MDDNKYFLNVAWLQYENENNDSNTLLNKFMINL